MLVLWLNLLYHVWIFTAKQVVIKLKLYIFKIGNFYFEATNQLLLE